MTKLNIFTTGRLLAIAIAAIAAVAWAPKANANLVFKYSSSASAHYSGGTNPTDNDIADCLGFGDSHLASILCVVNQDGSQSGGWDNAFNFQLNWRGFSMKFNGQDGTPNYPLCVVVQDSNNNCYVWDIGKSWNGTDGLDFSDICEKGSHITGITCYGDTKTPAATSAVPEPSTIVAGALLLLPLGVSVTRILRRNKIQPIAR